MTIEYEIFKRYSVDLKKLIEYGFKENRGNFSFTKSFRNDEFRAEVVVSFTGEVCGKVYETESNEEFLPLRVENMEGAFVSEVREQYKQILKEIRDKCYYQNYFISPQSNRITNAIMSKYGDSPNFMWEQFADYGVFKNADSNKWYAIIMNIDYSKLGEARNNPVEVINLKLDKDEIQKLLKQRGFYPAWHMNKKYWITIVLDDTLEDDNILKFVEESYSYTIKS